MNDIADKIEAALIDSESMYLDDVVDIIRTYKRQGDQKVVCRIQNLHVKHVSKKMNSKKILCTDRMVRKAIDGYIQLWRNPDIEFEYLKQKNIAK